MPSLSLPLNPIPGSQWAYVIQNQDVESKRVPVPRPEPDEVLVEIHFSGVCYSDYCLMKGTFGLPPGPGKVGGHEGAGIVVAVGDDVKNPDIGDRVGIQWINGSCGNCGVCCAGERAFCPKARYSGYTIAGTFQQYAICKAAHAVKIPEQVPLEIAAPFLCAGVTSYNAVKNSNVQRDQVLAIVGAGGGLGTFACQFAKAFGYRVLAISSGKSKRKMCMETLGADYFVDYSTSPNLVEEVVSLTGGGPHAAVVLATKTEAYDQAIQYVRPGGTIVVAGIPSGDLKANFFSLVTRRIMIKGSFVGTKEETEEALELWHCANICVQSKVYNFSELPDIYASMEKGELQGRAVLQMPEKHPWLHRMPNTLARPTFQPGQYTIGSRLAYRLEEIGASHFFAIPGDYNMSLLDQVLENKALNLVGSCNELNAGYAADGYARSSPSGVAVVMVTFMVGGVSLLNAIAGAYSERLKVIVVSGCPGAKLLSHPLVHHSIGTSDRDQTLRMFNEVTAASVRLDPQGDPAAMLDKTISKCLQSSLPVYIEIPTDMACLPCEAPEPLSVTETPSDPNLLCGALEAFATSWKRARRPIIIVGAFVRNLPSELLLAFIECLGCAVYCQPDSKSLVSENHPQFAGVFWGDVGSPECDSAVQQSDLWVVVGGRWSNLHTLGQIHLGRESNRMIDIQNGHIKVLKAQVSGVSLHEMLGGLIESGLPRNETTRPSTKKTTDNANEASAWKENRLISTKDIVHGVQSIIKANDTLLAETGDTWFQAQLINLPAGVAFQMQIVYASIGWSLPATLGCQLARPSGRAVLLIGDGSFQMTAQEVSIMIKMGINPIIIVFNNLGYAIEGAIHDGPYNYIPNWNYAALVKSMCTAAHYLDQQSPYAKQQPSSSPPLIAMQIKTTHELSSALAQVEQEPNKLALLECCLHPKDLSPMMYRLSAGMAKANETSYEPTEANGYS